MRDEPRRLYTGTCVEAYADATGENRSGILGWLPFVAAARLADGVPEEQEGLPRTAGSS